jgi:tRNA threonylcarbamoyladenosine dehydratase
LSTFAVEPLDAAADACARDERDVDRRFGGIARLYGSDALVRLAGSRVAIVGVGGVGSWAAEACARSAIGHLTLIDLDHVSESNINRQIHALDSTVGAAKVGVMATRVHDINPACTVDAIEEFVDPDNVAALFPRGRFDFVVDAIDHVRAKTALIAHCHAEGMPLITIGGAGGRTDASRVRVADLAHTEHEPMLAKVRKALRTQHGFSRNLKRTFGVTAVYSDQPSLDPHGAGPQDREGLSGLNCAGFGSAVAVTATFGFVAAGLVVDRLARGH